MQLGVSSFAFTWAIGIPGYPPDRPMTALDLLDKAARLGLSLVQICDNLPLDQLSPAELNTFERRASEVDISVEVGTRGIGPDRLRTYLGLARRLKSPILRVVIDTADHHPSPDEVVSTLKPLMSEFERARICLAIENHDRFRAQTLAQIIERVGGDFVGVCLDTANSFGALEGPDVVVKALGPRTVNLHVKDFVVQRAGHKLGFSVEGRPAGQGQLDIPWLLEALRIQGRDPNAILELWTPPEEALVATIAKEEAWAKASVEYLRQFIP